MLEKVFRPRNRLVSFTFDPTLSGVSGIRHIYESLSVGASGLRMRFVQTSDHLPESLPSRGLRRSVSCRAGPVFALAMIFWPLLEGHVRATVLPVGCRCW